MAQVDIESVLREKRVFPPAPEFAAGANLSKEEYERRVKQAADDPEGFWAEMAKQLDWFSPWSKVLEWRPPFAKWFVGATTNLTHNCVDRHLTGWRRNK